MTGPAARPGGTRSPRLTYLVKRLEMAERAHMEEVLRPLGVTLHQYTALSILEHRGGLSSAQLARRHVVSPQAMHQLIATMERDGLVERRADEANRRILRVWLTGRGAEALRACHRAVDDVEARMLSGLDAAQAAALAVALERCLAALTGRDLTSYQGP